LRSSKYASTRIEEVGPDFGILAVREGLSIFPRIFEVSQGTAKPNDSIIERSTLPVSAIRPSYETAGGDI